MEGYGVMKIDKWITDIFDFNFISFFEMADE